MDAQHARELLASERTRIEQALGDVTREEGEDISAPIQGADVAEGMFDRELEQAQRQRLRAELEAIERAEQRLVEGTYGFSVDSGEPIPDARLEAIPWAERTAAEQARFESTGS